LAYGNEAIQMSRKKRQRPDYVRKPWETRMLLNYDLQLLARGGHEMATALSELERRGAKPREERRRW